MPPARADLACMSYDTVLQHCLQHWMRLFKRQDQLLTVPCPCCCCWHVQAVLATMPAWVKCLSAGSLATTDGQGMRGLLFAADSDGNIICVEQGSKVQQRQQAGDVVQGFSSDSRWAVLHRSSMFRLPQAHCACLRWHPLVRGQLWSALVSLSWPAPSDAGGSYCTPTLKLQHQQAPRHTLGSEQSPMTLYSAPCCLMTSCPSIPAAAPASSTT